MAELEKELKSALAEMHKSIDENIKAVEEKAGEKGAEYQAAIAKLDESIKSLDDQVVELAQKHQMQPEKLEAKSFGDLVMESDGIKSFLDGTQTRGRVEVKNTILNGGGTSSIDQLGAVMGGAFQRLSVMPTLMTGTMSGNVAQYPIEGSWTNNAAVTVEGNTKPESDLSLVDTTKTAKTIPHTIKVSKQALADSSFLGSYIERRMRHGVNKKLEAYVISDATDGWVGNSTATSPLLTTDIYGLANKMKYEIIAADYEPAYFYMNPSDWSTAETTRRATGDDAFIAGTGAVAYVNNGLTPMLWGLPVVLTNSVAAGSMYCKSMDADMFLDRESTVVEMFEQDGDNVQKNLVTVRAEARGVECVFAPLAIRSGDITGITA